MGISRLHGIVTGRVQGVAFRYYTRAKAEGLGLSGWVRNLPDRNVEFEVQGEEEDLQEFNRFIRTGPPLARVENVIFNRREPVEGEAGFSITY